MSRKRTKRLTLVFLGSFGMLATGCGTDPKQVQLVPSSVDTVVAKKAAAAGVGANIIDAAGLAGAQLAAGPMHAGVAAIDLANLATIIDQADETLDVVSRETGVARSTSPQSSNRNRYHYHSGPGIGWFVWGYLLSRSMNRPYTPMRSYAPTPRPYAPRPSGGGTSGLSRSSPLGGGSSTSGGVSRGGFGSSGSAHASGGS